MSGPRIKTNQVIKCTNCGGIGMLGGGSQSVYHNDVEDIPIRQCKTCEGTGRLIETTSVTRVPFSDKACFFNYELDKFYKESETTQ